MGGGGPGGALLLPLWVLLPVLGSLHQQLGAGAGHGGIWGMGGGVWGGGLILLGSPKCSDGSVQTWKSAWGARWVGKAGAGP